MAPRTGCVGRLPPNELRLGMPAPLVIIHERVANWSRHLRPRFRGRAVRWSESRSTSTLLRAASLSTCPILVIEMESRPARGLEDLDGALRVAPKALSLVLEPRGRAEVLSISRELGATLVLGGVVVPPQVERVLLRWLPIAGRRSEAEGWSPSLEPEADPWDRPELFLDALTTGGLPDGLS